MTRIGQILGEVSAGLAERGHPFTLIGGLAVSARAEPRFTRDVDMAVAVPDDAAAERFVRGFLGAGYSVLATVEQETTGRLATVRLLPPAESPEGVVIDFLFASSGIEPEMVAAAEPIEVVPTLVVPVAVVGHLIALKILSRSKQRPQDLVDLSSLKRVAGTDDLKLARDSLQLIDLRGFSRGKALLADFDRFLRE